MTATQLRDLRELLSTSEGRAVLAAEDLHTDASAFRAALAPPTDPRLAEQMGVAGAAVVHMHQQIYVDHRPSVLEKVKTLDALTRSDDDGLAVHSVFLWIDTDRAASDKLACRFYWPFAGKLRALKITPSRTEHLETRFVDVDPARTEAAYDRLVHYVRHATHPSQPALARLSALRQHIVMESPTTLRAYGLALTEALFREHLQIDRTHVVLSELLASGWLNRAIEAVFDVLPEFTAAFNARVASLHGRGIGTAVGPWSSDHLPLHYVAPENGARLRLRHQVFGGDHFATAVGTTGQEHRFFLGTKHLSVDELMATGRVSPDVTLPWLLQELFSGWVAGKSSALYALVFQNVFAHVLGRRPLPILVPVRLGQASTSRSTSLLHSHVAGVPLG